MAKCKSYDLIFKLKVILQAECEGNRIVARYLHIDEKQIRQWRKQKCCMLKEIYDCCSRKKWKRLRGGQKAPHYNVESKLADWVIVQREKHLRVT